VSQWRLSKEVKPDLRVPGEESGPGPGKELLNQKKREKEEGKREMRRRIRYRGGGRERGDREKVGEREKEKGRER
jgi:hypothetical protein